MNKIKNARLIAGMTQRELAKQLGISHISVCRWERDKAFPSVKRIKQVAEILGTTVDELLKEVS